MLSSIISDVTPKYFYFLQCSVSYWCSYFHSVVDKSVSGFVKPNCWFYIPLSKLLSTFLNLFIPISRFPSMTLVMSSNFYLASLICLSLYSVLETLYLSPVVSLSAESSTISVYTSTLLLVHSIITFLLISSSSITVIHPLSLIP